MAGALTPPSIAVVGAGWAGLAAAVEAVRAGHSVTLFETAPEAGGRARRVQVGDRALDNGQHILIGAYSATLALMATLGVDVDAVLLRQPLRLVDGDGVGLILPPGGRHPSWDFATGVMAHGGWTLRARLALLAQAARWRVQGFRCPARQTVAELTAALPAAVRSGLTDPLCIAAMNTPAETASAQVFLRILRDALFGGPGAADLLLPRADLGRLVPEPALAWLRRHGAQIAMPGRVRRIEPLANGGWRVDGAAFDHVVVATSCTEAARLTRAVAPAWAAIAAALPFAPIVTVYVQVDGCRLPEPMLLLHCPADSGLAQHVFDLGQLRGLPGTLAFVVSGAADWVAKGAKPTGAAVLAQARSALRRWSNAEPVLLKVVMERQATIACTPHVHRPPTHVAAGLVAAGDYVEGPYPSTLEGAVRSGRAAVAALRAPADGRTATPAARR